MTTEIESDYDDNWVPLKAAVVRGTEEDVGEAPVWHQAQHPDLHRAHPEGRESQSTRLAQQPLLSAFIVCVRTLLIRKGNT
ncbi:hypothetical protein MHYP_G00164920 [Metynnis hypsauchen]